MAEDKHWTDPKDTSYSDEDRTTDLADDFIKKYKIMIKNPDHNIFAPLQKRLSDSITINDLLDYLEKHPDMLKYEFDENGKMSKIIVDPNRTFTFLDDSIERQCNMSYGITEMLKLITLRENSDPTWQTNGGVKIVMSNKSFCEGKGYTKPLQISTGPGNTAGSAGGSKSRRRHRRHAHKTRRGRGRGRSRKPKAKSKTHRRRRHSRIRKHKKNTYTRRR